MTNSIARSKSSILSIALIAAAVLGVAGAIYSLFPPGWYRPVSLGFILSLAAKVVLDTLWFCFPYIIALALFASFMVFKQRKLAPRTGLLFLPLIPMSLNSLWGAYCWSAHLVTLGTENPWTLAVTGDLICILSLTFFVVSFNVLGSSYWKNYRIFALCVLAIEFILSVGISFFEVLSTAAI